MKETLPNITEQLVEPRDGFVMSRIWYKFFEKISTVSSKGWTASTGIASKGPYAVYAGADPDLLAMSQRLKAMEDAMRAAGIIDG